jgi:Zn-dependent protease with chaperone function
MKALRYVGLALCVSALVGCASPGMSFWRAEEVAKFQSSSLRLHHKGETVGHVNPLQVRMLLDVQRKIEAVTPIISADLVIVNLKEPNAFASLRNGRPLIGVSLGMLELLSWDRDAYAAIVGHEYAHLALDHRANRAEREGTAEGARQALGLVLSFAGVPMGRTIANIGVTAVERVYTRDEEREADTAGFEYLVNAGFDPDGAVRLWQRMNTAGGFSIPFLSTHPMSSERIENMRLLARSSTQADKEAVTRSKTTTPQVPDETTPSATPSNVQTFASIPSDALSAMRQAYVNPDKLCRSGIEQAATLCLQGHDCRAAFLYHVDGPCKPQFRETCFASLDELRAKCLYYCALATAEVAKTCTR